MMKGKWLKALVAVACLTLAAGFSVSCKDEKTTGAVYEFNDPANEKYVKYVYTIEGQGKPVDTEKIYTEEEGYVLMSYSGSGAVEIPSEYNGKPVVAIANQAFMNCTEVTSVVIPDSVKVIGGSAFFNCSGLTSVTIGDNVEKIGNGAFGSCTSLTEIEIPASVSKIDDAEDTGDADKFAQAQWGGLFYDCDNLQTIRVHEDSEFFTAIDGNLYTKDETVLVQYAIGKKDDSFVIPDGVETIGRFAFGGNDSLKDVTLPDSVTIAGDGAFFRCSNLENVTIGSGLKEITRWMFYDCDKITKMDIPSTVVEAIGERSFYNCDGLTEVTIPGGYWTDDEGTPWGTTITENAFEACTNLRKVTTGYGVEIIGTKVFANCTNLTEVSIAQFVQIKKGAFEGCKSLTEITLPYLSRQQTIEENVFAGCDSLTVYCEAYVEYDEEGEYSLPPNCNWNVSWNKYDTKKVINEETGEEEEATFFCPVVWNSTEDSIATDGYMYTVVDGVRYRVKVDFVCKKCGKTQTPHSQVCSAKKCDGAVKTIVGDFATVTKQGIGLEEAIIAETVTINGVTYNVTGIEEEAFYDCEDLTKVVIPESVTSIGPWAFFGCYGLTVYCEAENQPESWGESWNLTNTPVVWDYNGEE